MNYRLLLPALAVVFTACPQPTPTPDGGGAPAPLVTSVTPATGPTAGGTTVAVNGTNFVRGATVSIGGALATNVAFESDKRLSAITPAASSAGAVTVTVTNPDGKLSALPNAFTYTGTTTTRTITEALLTNPAEAIAMAGAVVVVTGHVQVPMVTAGSGQGAGVRAQVGFSSTVGATPSTSDFTWSDAAYVTDADGAAQGDLARDAYAGSVTLAGPTTGTQIIYFLAVRFSVDDGQTWTLADRDGAANGALTTQLAKVAVLRAGVEWCKLGGQTVEAPPVINLRGAAAGPLIYGQVYKMGSTDAAGAGPGIKGQLGYGQAGSDPATWTWADAAFNVDTGAGANDEFQAALPNPGSGTWKFAFRFSHEDGAWAYCDADGLANNGFTEDQAGTLTITTVGVDSCKLQAPATLTSYEGRPSELVYGRLFVQGLTEDAGAPPGVEGQLGFGSGANPTDPSWVWSAAAFNPNHMDMGGGDEFEARLTGPTPGAYFYAYRFRVAGGAWAYCDRDPNTAGLQQAELGALTALPFDVAECVLEAATAQQTTITGATSQPYTAVVTVPTLTTGAGQGTPLTVQVGTGTPGTAPSTWTSWSNATYVNDAQADTADRYAATVTAPSTAGSRSVAFRVQVGTRPSVYCDQDGSMNGFSDAQVGRITAAANAFLSSCTLNAPSGFSVASGERLVISARAQVPGVSGNSGATPTLRVQVGVGPRDDDASASTLWGWQDATFNADIADGGEDEFTAVTFPAYTGSRAVSARASLDGGAWTYCDLNGSATNGYEVSQQYNVTVGNHAALAYCDTRVPGGPTPPGTLVYGQVYMPDGLTPDASTPFIAQLGLGVESEDPGLAWQWSSASFNYAATAAGNNNEYLRAIPAGTDAGVRFAFRYSLDGGSWCYGDFNGSTTDGFSGGANIGTVAP